VGCWRTLSNAGVHNRLLNGWGVQGIQRYFPRRGRYGLEGRKHVLFNQAPDVPLADTLPPGRLLQCHHPMVRLTGSVRQVVLTVLPNYLDGFHIRHQFLDRMHQDAHDLLLQTGRGPRRVSHGRKILR
jgi:hypothetical protein